MAHVARLLLYPIKSLDPVSVDEVTLTPAGSLQYDRTYRLVDPQGRVINGKRTPQIQLIRSHFDPQSQQLQLTTPTDPTPITFDLSGDPIPLERWFADFFGIPVHLQADHDQGFPDDVNASGPTLISTATIETTAAWFSGIPADQMRARLRMNVEIADVPPFWEDTLFAQAGEIVPFSIGSITLHGINPCARCIVPTRDPFTGDPTPHFQKTFVQQRRAQLPEAVLSRPIQGSRFDHFYRLGLNTRIPAHFAGQRIRVGDPVQVI